MMKLAAHILKKVALLLIMQSVLVAQDGNYHKFALSLGLSDMHLRDDHASPLYFRSQGFNSRLQYSYSGNNFQQFIELSYSYNHLKSNNSNFSTDNWCGKIKYAYLIPVNDFKLIGRPCRFFIGSSICTFLNIADYHYLNEELLAIKSWYANHSINAEFYIMHTINENNIFSAEFTIPLIGNISRPDYSPSMYYNYKTNSYKVKLFGTTKFFPDNLFINTNLLYKKTISNRINLLINYDFFYTTYSRPKEFDLYSNSFLVGIQINI